MSYLRNYIIIALGLYTVSGIKYFLQANLLWTPWQSLKTTNLFIMHYMERLNAHTKKKLYNASAMSIYRGYIEDVRDKMDAYGLMRDKIYCLMSHVFYNIKNIFGISRYSKRNYWAIILTVLFTKRAKLIGLIVSIYHKRIQYKLGAALHKMYEVIKSIDPIKIKKLGISIIGIIVVLIIIRISCKLWNKYIKKMKTPPKSNSVELQIEVLEQLNILQNKLGDYIILIVSKVRVIDKLLAECNFKNYRELAQEICEELNACEAVVAEIKRKVTESEQVKEIQIYGMYNTRYSKYVLALIDLSKEVYGEKVLKRYQIDSTYGEEIYDEDVIGNARQLLYDYLKKCIEYYDELDIYLAKVNRRKRRRKKKIYKIEQVANMKLVSGQMSTLEVDA